MPKRNSMCVPTQKHRAFVFAYILLRCFTYHQMHDTKQDEKYFLVVRNQLSQFLDCQW